MNRVLTLGLVAALTTAELLCVATARADDVNLIPDVLLDAPPPDSPPASSARSWTLFAEASATSTHWRDSGPGARPDWTTLTRVGGRIRGEVAPHLTATLDAQATWSRAEGTSPRGDRDLRLDIKEASLGWAATPTLFVDAGRITLRSGVALGFNPTDHFRAGALLDRSTEDASQARENRLGTVALRLQALWSGGAAALAVSPGIGGEAARWWNGAKVGGLNLAATNPRPRTLLTLSQEITPNLAPHLVLLVDGRDLHVGANLSTAATDWLLVHGEWSAGQRRPLLAEGMRPGGSDGMRVHHASAVGATVTPVASVSLTLEHHYNEAGLDGQDWAIWRAAAASPPSAGRALAVRRLAQERQDPLSRHTLWSRLQWQEALGDPDLTLTLLGLLDPGDGSALVQGEATYAVTGATSATLRAASFLGSSGSQYGSVPRASALTFRLRHHF